MKPIVLTEDGEKFIWTGVNKEVQFHYNGGIFHIEPQEEEEYLRLEVFFCGNIVNKPARAINMGHLRIPHSHYFKQGLHMRYSLIKDVLYFRYEDIKRSSIYAVGLRKDAVFTTTITEKIYKHLSDQSERDVKKDSDQMKTNREKDVDLANLRVSMLTNDEKYQQKVAQLEQGAKDLEERHKLESAELKKQLENSREVAKQKQEYIDALPRNELASVRGKNTDFKIVCSDGAVIPVHQAILAAFWPFFNIMMENKCKEKEDRTLNLDYRSDVVELLVADIYGQKIDFDFNQALSLLELTGLYDLPDLSAMAYEKILLSEPDLDLEDCVNGWRSSRLANHALGKLFFTKLVISKMKPALEKDEDLSIDFEGMTQHETLELFFDSLRM